MLGIGAMANRFDRPVADRVAATVDQGVDGVLPTRHAGGEQRPRVVEREWHVEDGDGDREQEESPRDRDSPVVVHLNVRF